MASTRKAKAAVTAGLMGKLIAAVAEKHGGDALRRIGDAPRKEVEVISTGSFGVNRALGIGGLPRGRICEVYGASQSGKTTFMLHQVACAQKAGLAVAYIDAEHALDLNYAANLGVDVENMLLAQPQSGEEALDIVVSLCEATFDILHPGKKKQTKKEKEEAKKSGKPELVDDDDEDEEIELTAEEKAAAAEAAKAGGILGLIIVDSVAAMTPQSELEEAMEKSAMGLHARMMSRGMRKIVAVASRSGVTVAFVNQTRSKVGVVFGDPTYRPGGTALPFANSVCLKVSGIGDVKQGDEKQGRRVRVRVDKNKFDTPFREVEYDLIYGKGISFAGELVDHGVGLGLIRAEKTTLWFGETKLGAGRPKAKEFLEANAAVAAKLEADLIAIYERDGFIRLAKGSAE